MRNVHATLPKARFFEGLDDAALDDAIAMAEVRKIGPHQILFVAGDDAARLFLLVSGHAKFYRTTSEGKKVLLARFARGQVFGLGTLNATNMRYIATAETTEPCELLVWKRARIRKLADKYPRLAENALAIVLTYLQNADRFIDLITLPAPHRLRRAVWRLAKESGKTHPTGIEIEATNDDLAELAHISAYTASRVLNKWRRAGALSKSRGRVMLHAPENLMNP